MHRRLRTGEPDPGQNIGGGVERTGPRGERLDFSLQLVGSGVEGVDVGLFGLGQIPTFGRGAGLDFVDTDAHLVELIAQGGESLGHVGELLEELGVSEWVRHRVGFRPAPVPARFTDDHTGCCMIMQRSGG